LVVGEATISREILFMRDSISTPGMGPLGFPKSAPSRKTTRQGLKPKKKTSGSKNARRKK